MARYLIPKSFTLYPEQVEHIEMTVGNKRREQSQWVREAIALRIQGEINAANENTADKSKDVKLRRKHTRS